MSFLTQQTVAAPMPVLNPGIPTVPVYDELLRSEAFRNLEGFSQQFLETNRGCLSGYSSNWVGDPLHQWSRQWEYAFVLQELTAMNGGGSLDILDAGSGATFFPFFLRAYSTDWQVTCCDRDRSLEEVFWQLNENSSTKVNFTVSELQALPFDDASFDRIYCISVLEHTAAYRQILDEFRRVLRPGGKVVLTFDISIDGKSDIPPSKAEFLLELVRDVFGSSTTCSLSIMGELGKADLVTTQHFVEKNPSLLPWKRASVVQNIKSILKYGVLKSRPSLTFFCLSAGELL